MCTSFIGGAGGCETGKPQASASAEEDVEAVLQCVADAVSQLHTCISDRLQAVRAAEIRNRVQEEARLKRLDADVSRMASQLEQMQAKIAKQGSAATTCAWN